MPSFLKGSYSPYLHTIFSIFKILKFNNFFIFVNMGPYMEVKISKRYISTPPTVVILF